MPIDLFCPSCLQPIKEMKGICPFCHRKLEFPSVGMMERVAEKLSKTNTQDELVNCPNCHGSGNDVCPRCGFKYANNGIGSSLIKRNEGSRAGQWTVCPVCNGVGYDTRSVCPACQGNKRIPASRARFIRYRVPKDPKD